MTRRLIGTALVALLAALAGPLPAAADDPNDDPIYYLTQFENAASGLCLDIPERGDINGSPAMQDNCAWSIQFDDVMADWPYDYLVIRGELPKCLEVENFSTASYASVAQHDCNGGPHQQWRYVPSGFTGTSALARWLSSSFMIQNRYSGKCLEISGHEIFARIVQNDCDRGLDQLWFGHSYRYSG